MNVITIDCADIRDKAGFHAAVAKALSFPDYYGNNLDALHAYWFEEEKEDNS